MDHTNPCDTIDVATLQRYSVTELPNKITPQWTYIYGLCEPETGEIRYVGKSKRPVKRLDQHLCSSRQTALKHQHCARWLETLRARNVSPTIVLLESIPPESESTWEKLERHWIRVLRASNHNLTNICDGGEGGGTRGRLGKKNSPEHIAKTRAGRLGKPVRRRDPEGWNRRKTEGIRLYYKRMRDLGIQIKYGPASEERKRKISEANRGKKHVMSAEWLENIRLAAKRKTPPGQKAVVQMTMDGQRIADYPSIHAAARSLGILHTSISNCLNKKAASSGGFTWVFSLGPSLPSAINQECIVV